MALEQLRLIPRAKLWASVTPLEAQHNLARLTGADSFLIKRDDCNGFALGSCKVRHMEYYLGDALRLGADTLIMHGGRQPNLSRIAAAACARHGIACHIILEIDKNNHSDNDNENGQFLEHQFLGAQIHEFSLFSSNTEASEAIEDLARQHQSEGFSPYTLDPYSSKSPLGSIGYIHTAMEVLEQLELTDYEPDVIFCPTGTGNTYAGLLFGLRALGSDIAVVGVCVQNKIDDVSQNIKSQLKQLSNLLDEDLQVGDEDILLTDQYLDQSINYCEIDPDHPLAIAALHEGLIIDPHFNGKSFTAAFDYAKQNTRPQVLLINTGGNPSHFGLPQANRQRIVE